jgi:geranylgeranyl diphosphate synthase, type II
MRNEVSAYLEEAREDVLAEIRRLAKAGSPHGARLYDLMLEYPLRPAKGLRPALCFATCGLLGGTRDAALPSATALELYHNAFLIHDDIEDGSVLRRHSPTLHRHHGLPIALHVGDGMLALALEPLLVNTKVVGVAAALQVLQICARMTRESAEGQMMELEWIRERRWNLRDRDYIRMVYKKTAWYTFLAPVLAGAAVARRSAARVGSLARFATLLGVAFQIVDDLLDLEGEQAELGKQSRGDLWEGKRTLVLLHALRSVGVAEREELVAILDRPPPSSRTEQWAALHEALQRVPLDDEQRVALERVLVRPHERSQRDVDRLWTAMEAAGSTAHARAVASAHAQRAALALDHACHGLPDSPHRRFLRHLVTYTVERSR